jgi:purine-cytosine permease-like protein
VSPLSRLLPQVLVAVTVLAGAAVLVAVGTAGPAVASDGPGLTEDQYRTGRLVFGVAGLAFMALLAVGAVRGWRARRGPSDDG